MQNNFITAKLNLCVDFFRFKKKIGFVYTEIICCSHSIRKVIAAYCSQSFQVNTTCNAEIYVDRKKGVNKKLNTLIFFLHIFL